MAVIIRGNITDKALVKEVLTNRRLHHGIIDTADEPTKFNKIWQDYQAKIAKGYKEDFSEYVKRRPDVKTRPKVSEEMSVVQEMGVGFVTKTNPEKNLALLGRTEPELAAELAKPASNSMFGADLHAKLTKLMDSDIIGNQSIYSKARGKVVRKFNDLIAANVKNYAEFKELMKRTKTGGSIGALGEATAKKFNIPPGAAKGTKATVKVKGLTGPGWPGGEVQVIIDNFSRRTKKIGEIKVGTSFDEAQFERYVFFLKNQKKIQQRLIDAGIPKGKINGISYGLLPGPNDIVAVEKAAAAGQKIVDPVRKRAKQLWSKLSIKDPTVADKLEIHFATVDGVHFKIGKSGKVVRVKKVK